MLDDDGNIAPRPAVADHLSTDQNLRRLFLEAVGSREVIESVASSWRAVLSLRITKDSQ